MDKSTLQIAISREFGCGGRQIGMKLAERLGLHFLDKEITKRAASHLNEDETVLADREGRLMSFLENLFCSFTVGSIESPCEPSAPFCTDLDIYRAEALAIREMAERFNLVVLGRCGFHILKGHRGLISVFLHAPVRFRIQQLLKRGECKNEDEAQALVEEKDSQRARYVQAMTGSVWTDARNYHMSLDISTCETDEIIEMIIMLAQKKRGDE